MLSQKFGIYYRLFTSVLLCTQTLHQQWLHTRTWYKKHQKCEMLKLWRRLCAKQLRWQSCHLGGSYLFMKYDVFIQNAEFFLRIELISFKSYWKFSLLYKSVFYKDLQLGLLYIELDGMLCGYWIVVDTNSTVHETFILIRKLVRGIKSK